MTFFFMGCHFSMDWILLHRWVAHVAFHLDLSEVGSLGFLRPLGEEIYWAFLAHIIYSIEEIESMGFWTKYVMSDF